MRIAITGVRDGLLVIGLALLVIFLLFAAFELADRYHIKLLWVYFVLNSILIIPLFVRGFRGNLGRSYFILFLAGLAIAHGLVVISLMN
jgi:hypothetical protein